MATIVERKTKNGKSKYQVKIKVKNSPFITRTFDKKTDAKNWAYQEETRIKNSLNFQNNFETSKITLTALIDEYINSEAKRLDEYIEKNTNSPDCNKKQFLVEELPKIKRYKEDLKTRLTWWKEQMGHLTLDKCFNKSLLIECRNRLTKEPYTYSKDEYGNKTIPKYRSASTLNKYANTLSSAFNYGINSLAWLDKNPMHLLPQKREPKGRVRFLSEEEKERLLNECKKSPSKYLYIFVLITLFSGSRFSEVRYIKYSDIDLKNRKIYINKTKNGESKGIYIPDVLYTRLQEFLKVRSFNSDYIFSNDEGKPEDIRKAFRAAVKKANIANFHFHDLRHTTASYLAMNGASLLEIAEVMGHKTLAMVKRYSHLTQSHTNNVIEKMTQKCFSNIV